MSVKYRIEYDAYNSYTSKKKKTKPLLPFLVCTLLVLLFILSPGTSKITHILLPGNPDITIDAFQQLSNSINKGVPLSDALDTFCNAVISSK